MRRCNGGTRADDGPRKEYIILRIVVISCLVASFGHHSSTNIEPHLNALTALAAVVCAGFGFVWAGPSHRTPRSRRGAWRGSLARRLGLVRMAQLMEWTLWCFLHTQGAATNRPSAIRLALHLCWVVQQHHGNRRWLRHILMNVLLLPLATERRMGAGFGIIPG